MKKNKLKVVVICLAVGLMGTVPYFGEAIPRGVGDALQLFVVMAILTVMETDALGVLLGTGTDYSDLIPQCIKKVIGVVMLLGLASTLRQAGWTSTGYFDDAIISQLPITLVDVSVLVIVGTILYWAGGIAYQTMITATTSIGNICYYVLGKMGLVELEDDEEEGEAVDTKPMGEK